MATLTSWGRRSAVLGLVGVVLWGVGCAPRAIRGGPGTENPSLDEPAMSTTLDRSDVEYLVAQTLDPLESSKFWMRDVKGSMERPLLAIWPIENRTSQHLEDQLLTLLSSIETTLVESGDVRMVDRTRQAELTRELGVQRGAAYDPRTARELGRQLGVQYFVTGKITSIEEKLSNTRRVQYTLFLQILEVETGLIEYQREAVRSKALKG
ncbi:penicillin-binding protein activator LpoB [Myxococcota bacterium]|nr:penicillin-binding protein activator LpoB [Myxococcota bacterium]